MSARNGPADDDRRPHEGERRIGERLGGHSNSNAKRRQKPLWHAHADVRTVVGRAGNRRLVLIVDRCPGCHQPHLHQARLPFTATVRKGACGARYMVHALHLEAAA